MTADTDTDTDTDTARTGTEVARWLLPLLKEYTDKLNAVCDRSVEVGLLKYPIETLQLPVLVVARFLAIKNSSNTSTTSSRAVCWNSDSRVIAKGGVLASKETSLDKSADLRREYVRSH